MNYETIVTICLEHQRSETLATPIGRLCPSCKEHLYTRPPSGKSMAFWESQPVAYSRNREPCFVFTQIWDDFQIRSLFPPDPTAEKLN